MFDFIRRALTHPLDYLPVFKRQSVELIRIEEHGAGIKSFIFKKPDGLTWKAGQHGVWWFKGEQLEGGNWRAFSIASSHLENEIRISTTFPPEPSAFKQKLLALQPGDTMWLQGPFGEFHLQGKGPVVGVAGGIGITPFRAIAYELSQGVYPNSGLDLIYSAREEHTFKTELDEWVAATDNLKITYIHTAEEVQSALSSCAASHDKMSPVLISGSPGMIKALTTSCYDKGIRRVISDPFKGY